MLLSTCHLRQAQPELSPWRLSLQHAQWWHVPAKQSQVGEDFVLFLNPAGSNLGLLKISKDVRNIQKRSEFAYQWNISMPQKGRKNLLSTIHKNMTKLPKTKIFSSSNYFEAHKIQHLGILTENKNINKTPCFPSLNRRCKLVGSYLYSVLQ